MAGIYGRLTALSCGLISHSQFFIRDEHHTRAPFLLRLYLSISITIFFVNYYQSHPDTYNAFYQTVEIAAFYIAGIFSSIACYRLILHRTKHFPGPPLAGLSKFYHLFKARNSKQYLWLDTLHKQYGDFVRTGPNEITIFNPDAIQIMHGPQSRCTKAAWYDNILPMQAVVTTRSKEAHDTRRRIWDQGYSVRALIEHEDTILHYAELLKDRIEQGEGKPINVTEWFEYYGFDVMAAIQYSKSFGMLRDGKSHWVLEVFKGGTVVLGYLTSIPWLMHILFSLPLLNDGFAKYSDWAAKSIRDRIKNPPEKQDTIGWLIDAADKHGGIEADWWWMMGDFLAIVTGGTEPVISGVVYLFYHLASSVEFQENIREEIRSSSSYSSSVQLQAMPFLNACIMETFRLHPSIPSGGLRTTPPEGLQIGETFIPGHTTVLTPHYSLQRREDCFVHANEFIPERWTTKPELILDRGAFTPWGIGPYACVGKNLGLMEIRTVTVLLLDHFDFSLAPGEDGSQLHEETLDCFATIPGPLRLVFKKRDPQACTE